MMAILSPIRDVGETLLTTLATLVVSPTTEPSVEVDAATLLTKTTSMRTTKPLVEIEPPLDEVCDSLPGETGDMKGRSETGALEELYAHVTTTHHATGTEDAFQSYLRDIRRFGLLTHAEEIDLARRAAAGDEQARRELIESNLRLLIALARRYMSSGVPLIDLIQEGNLGSCMPPRNLTIGATAILAPMPPGGFARR